MRTRRSARWRARSWRNAPMVDEPIVLALTRTLRRLPEDKAVRVLSLCLSEGEQRRIYGMACDFALDEVKRILDEPQPWKKEAS